MFKFVSGRLVGSGRRPKAAGRRLGMEALEAREVPAAYSWVPTGPGAYEWTDPANWTGGPAGTFPNAAGDTASLTGALTGNQLVNLGQNITLGGLTVGATGSASSYTIAADGLDGRLTFDTLLGTDGFLTSVGSGGAILAPIVLASENFFDVTGGTAARLGLGGDVTGSGTLIVDGGVTLFNSTTVGPGVVLGGSGDIASVPLLYATSFYDGALYAFDEAGAVRATLVAPNAASSLVLPAGLTTGPDGDLYISNQGVPSQPGAPSNNSIVKYDLDTFAVSTFVTAAQLQAIADPTNTNTLSFAPAGLRFGPDGNLYVSQNGGFGSQTPGSVIRFGVSNTGTALTYDGTNTRVASGQLLPSGLTFGTLANGTLTTLYVSTAAGVNQIASATGATPVVTPFIAGGTGGLEFPAGLAFGPGGDLFVADLAASTKAGKVLRFNPDGTADGTFVASGTGANPGDLFGQFPSDLQFDPQGRLLVANLGPNGPTQPGANANDYAGSVRRYTAAGAFEQALLTAAQFPDTQDTPAPGDDEATGVIPSQLARTAAGTLTATSVRPSVGPNIALTVPGLSFADNGSFEVFLASGNASRLESPGAVDLNNAALILSPGTPIPAGTSLVVVRAAGGVTGQFAGVAEGQAVVFGGQEFTVSYQAEGGTAVTLTSVDNAPDLTGPFAAEFTVGVPVNFQIGFTGAAPTTFAVTAGALPDGLTLDPASGLITGTPTAVGPFTPTISVTNSFGTDAGQFTFTVASPPVGVAPQFTSPNQVSFVAGTGGTFQVTASGTPAPDLAVAGNLPTGVTFDPASGALVVGPNTPAGTYVLQFSAVNSSGTASQQFALNVTPTGVAPAITSEAVITFTQGVGGTFQVTASGSPSPTLSQSEPLPAGVSFDPATGVLTVDPTAAAGTTRLEFTATNSFGTATQGAVLQVVALAEEPEITSGGAVTFTQGQGGDFVVTATGSPAPVFGAAGLPPGVTFDPETATLTVASTVPAGTFTVQITASNTAGSDTEPLVVTVVAAGAAPAFTSPPGTQFIVGQPGTFAFAATGDPAPEFAVAGTLPAGLTFDPAAGTLSGTPTVAGSFPLSVTARNSSGEATQSFTLVVRPPASGTVPAFTSLPAVSFVAGRSNNFVLSATGSPAPTFTATNLPAGLTLTPAGVLSGTPTVTGTFPVTVTATNTSGSASQNLTITVTAAGAAPAFTGTSGATLRAGTGGTVTLSATGSPTPTLAVTSPLPAGTTFDPATGVLRVGTATPAGTYPLTVTATNSQGSATQTFTLRVTTTAPAAALPSRLSVTGPADSTATLFDPSAGKYSGDRLAVLSPFAGLNVTVRSAVADVDGDGTPDTVVVTGPGTPLRFAVVSGRDNRTLLVPPTAPFAGSEDFALGGFVDAADLDGDGRAEVIVSPDQGGGPRVTVFSLPVNATAPVVRANFFGIDDPDFRGGARVAAGDVNADGVVDLAVAAGFTGGPRVALFDGRTLLGGTPTRLVGDFFAFPGSDAVTLRNGAYVALGDVSGDGAADLIFGGGPGGGPRVFVLDGKLVSSGSPDVYTRPVANFFVAGNSTDRGGVRVAAVDADADGRADIAVGSGTNLAATVRVYLGANVTGTAEPTTFQDLPVFNGAVLADGVYVG